MNENTLLLIIAILAFSLLLSRLMAHKELTNIIAHLKEDRANRLQELEEVKAERDGLTSKLFEANNMTAILIAESNSESIEGSRVVHNVKSMLQKDANPMTLISNGHLGKALDMLLSVTTGEDYEDVVALKGRFARVAKQVDRGTISNKEFDEFVNEIRSTAIAICINHFPNPPP